MTFTLTPQIRILALVALLAAAAIVVSTQLATRGVIFSSGPEPAKAPADVAPAAEGPSPAAKAEGKAAGTIDPAKAAKSSGATPTTEKRAARRGFRTHGLPVPLARALEHDRVVVVSLFSPGAAVDRLSRAEAEAGAQTARAGFVALNVLRRQNSEPLAAKLGAVTAPSVLVYTRPAKVFVKLDGFADGATVAQAADNARP